MNIATQNEWPLAPELILGCCDESHDPARRYDLTRPWRAEDGRGVATDGRIILEFEDGSAFDTPGERRVPPLSGVEKTLTGLPVAAACWPPAIDVAPPPDGGDPWWHTGDECAECGGSGEVTDDHGFDNKCCECDGEGRIGGYWWAPWEGRPRECRGNVVVADLKIAHRYAWIIAQLPDLRVGVFANPANPSAMLGFHFRGGRGVLAPLASD